MIMKLAVRNLGRNISRLRPMLVALLLAFALLLAGNAILEQTDRAFSAAYVNHVSGQVTVSESSDDPFTLFGSDALIVGEYLVAPTLSDPQAISASLESTEAVVDHTFVVTGAARLEVHGNRETHFLFGVDFQDYTRFFPSLQLLAGSLPDPGSAGIVLQLHSFRDLFGSDDPADHLGESVLLSAALPGSFVLREAPLAGVYEYPVRDTLLDQVALVDADTVRSLNGFVAASSEAAVPEDQAGFLTGDIDDLFGESSEPESGSDRETGSSMLDEVDSLFEEPLASQPATGPTVLSNAWNYALVRGGNRSTARSLARALRSEFAAGTPYTVSDWRSSIGGNVLLVHAVRIVANVGMLFVIFGAVVTTINSIVLSVLDRTKEIGTMRAMGAGKGLVARLVTTETTLAVFGAAGIGVLLGVGAILLLNAASITVSNQYLRILFGGAKVGGFVSGRLLILHFAGALLLAGLSVVYPLAKALRLTPLRAMNG